MHLLATQAGDINDGAVAVDLRQTPGDVVVLSAADSELAALAAARRALGEGFPRLRLANLMALGHPMSVDIYVDRVITRARVVIVRLLGGVAYWPYGIEQITEACRRHAIPLAVLPGDDQPDPALARLCSLPAAAWQRLWRYGIDGGPENMRSFLGYAATLAGFKAEWAEPRPLLRAGLYWPGQDQPDLGRVQAQWADARAPVAALVFYRALLQGAGLTPVDGLIAALAQRGLNPLPVFVASLKDPVSAATLSGLMARTHPDIVLNTTGFAVGTPGQIHGPGPFSAVDAPVLQVVFAGGSAARWHEGTRGLSAADLAMNVALPEVDGRIISRAVSFKAEAQRDPWCEIPVIGYEPVTDRIAFVTDLAAAWVRLRRTPVAARRVAVVLANYPNRDGRIGNGVGLDTPASAIAVLRAMQDAGYHVSGIPRDGDALMARLTEGPTNALLVGAAARAARPGGVRFAVTAYRAWLATLPDAVQAAVSQRWGDPDNDPFVAEGDFVLPAFSLGAVVVGIQPARGYNIDPKRSYHDPALVPPHGYLAFYAWLRTGFVTDAIVQLGKHGNLEWLPGKAVALSQTCFPEVALGPTPHLYPFIVNDPGEGTQAKRRAAAVIISHLTPPLTRAETYGPLSDLEALVDEYYQAAGFDPRRLALLGGQIIDRARSLGLDRDCGVLDLDPPDIVLTKLDNHLCELKELQIRDGLHIFGQVPVDRQETDLLVALTRVPRGTGAGEDASLLRALARDLDLTTDSIAFDPLSAEMARPWSGPRPTILTGPDPWRSQGDTVERLELLAAALVAGTTAPSPDWVATVSVLTMIDATLRPMLRRCGADEMARLLVGLDGRFVEPGPSGAPTRGRLDMLPTGRNFYAIDNRAVPTPAAWQLGWASAGLVLDRYRQDHGEWPQRLALSAWGTANMRTGGDDIAQALALMGVRPRWDEASRRVVGFEIMPLSVLDRPRVDVTFRVSGFFRDAFPTQIDLIDSAARAVALLDEAPALNPLAARVRADTAALMAAGVPADQACRRAGYRVFGSKPGAYGAGLQALIDERGWDDVADLGRSYVAWGGYAYGAGAEGAAEHGLFETRLAGVEAVLHNQDNREHDLLDSDDYYQFEGGITAAITHLAGRRPAIYHNDHSRPERPVVRSLAEEIGRIVRGRAVNPKWLAGVMRHGYKGAAEIAATVDYLFAFAATTGAVSDQHFDAVFTATLDDAGVRQFLLDNNPAAAREIAERLREALSRGLWRPRANHTHEMLDSIAERESP
ncbi:MAG: cobaltochelatase subunit CobN [Azospirillaceae bacterium]|nr:cobaltochelatase subunit CobN [Azospirillaceae bacterium]